jgi:hypothetical protein
MRSIRVAALLPALLAGAFFAHAQETMPAGITCCDEQKIRLAMAEEALARIAARGEPGFSATGPAGDYLSAQAYEKIRNLLPAGGTEQRLAYLREILGQTDPGPDIREFQVLVGHFVLGMTLEIANTFQDETDQARHGLERLAVMLGELERTPAAGADDLNRALFRADVSERELRRIRGLERRWKGATPADPPFEEFSALKRNICGRGADPDQQMAFAMAERYRARFPFLDEFLANYRNLAADFRETARRLNEHLALIER